MNCTIFVDIFIEMYDILRFTSICRVIIIIFFQFLDVCQSVKIQFVQLKYLRGVSHARVMFSLYPQGAQNRLLCACNFLIKNTQQKNVRFSFLWNFVCLY
eukprot:EC097328.1.p5 GENE.EC097328.1~~EC097328.1.p5  ORF type:complete len:100 (+),score=4.64 EC097328.1:238-537(+)